MDHARPYPVPKNGTASCGILLVGAGHHGSTEAGRESEYFVGPPLNGSTATAGPSRVHQEDVPSADQTRQLIPRERAQDRAKELRQGVFAHRLPE